MRRIRKYGLRSMAGLLTTLVILVPVLLIAISEKHFFEVEHDNETELYASLDIALGKVTIGRADPGYLFQAEVTLENERLIPDFDYDVSGREGRLNVDLTTGKDNDDSVSLPDLDSVTKSHWNLFFGDEVPINLRLELAGTASKLDFTGIPLRTLRIELEASQGSIVINEPNPIEMDYLRIESGASELTVAGLVNTRAQLMHFEGGMGKFVLDFTGDSELLLGRVADIEVGMASLKILLPESGAIILEIPDSWFCSVKVPDDYVQQDEDVYYSPDYEPGEEVFRIMVEAAIGQVEFATAP